MAGSGAFDDIIRAEIAARGNARLGNVNRGDPSQDARDAAARRINVRTSGVQSTAMPSAFHNNQIVAESGQGVNLPRNAPVPKPRPMDEAIEEQVGGKEPDADSDDVPLPQARPAAQMGDASAMEAAAGWRAPNAMPDNVGVQVPNPAAAAPAAPVADAGSGYGTPAFVALLASLGGVAGAAQLYRRWQLGDADAARTFAAVGMDPNDFALFAGGGATPVGPAATGVTGNGGQPSQAAIAARIAGEVPPNEAGIQVPPTYGTDPRMNDAYAPYLGDVGVGTDANPTDKGPRVPRTRPEAAASPPSSTMSAEERAALPGPGVGVDANPADYKGKKVNSTEEIIKEAMKLRPRVKVRR